MLNRILPANNAFLIHFCVSIALIQLPFILSLSSSTAEPLRPRWLDGETPNYSGHSPSVGHICPDRENVSSLSELPRSFCEASPVFVGEEPSRGEQAHDSTCTGFLSAGCFSVSALFSFFSILFSRYQVLLYTHPAPTKSITAGVVSLSGDLLAQTIERLMLRRRASFDLHRSITVGAEGLCISGPILHFAYDYFELFVTRLSVESKVLETCLQVLMDIFILDSLFTATLMVTSALLQGRRKDIVRELRTEYIPAVKVAWISSLTMSPLQFLNFGYIPLRFRVLVTNFQDVIWNAAVSYMAHRSRT